MVSGSSVVLAISQFFWGKLSHRGCQMRQSLKSFSLWEYADQDEKVPPLRANPTIAQIKQHEEIMKKEKVVSCLHSSLTDEVFTNIMHLNGKANMG